VAAARSAKNRYRWAAASSPHLNRSKVARSVNRASRPDPEARQLNELQRQRGGGTTSSAGRELGPPGPQRGTFRGVKLAIDERSFAAQPTHHLGSTLEQVRQGPHLVDDSEPKCFFTEDSSAGDDEFGSGHRPDQPGEALSPARSRHQAQRHFRQPEGGGRGGNSAIASQCELEPTAQRKAINRRHDWTVEPFDLFDDLWEERRRNLSDEFGYIRAGHER